MSDKEHCPECGSGEVSRLMQAFWVTVTADGGLEGEWSDYESCTELGDERLCRCCGHEWIDE